MATPPVPELFDDLIAEILLRVSPQTPSVLIRCSAVCKAWRRLLTSTAFLRRYRAFHGRAPLLGVLYNMMCPPSSEDEDHALWQFGLKAAFRPLVCLHGFVHDARHGRVLFHHNWRLIVWDPVSGEQREIPMPEVDFSEWDATVLCAAHLRGCDHLHCRGGPFLVAFVGAAGETASACVYSSETGAWGDAITDEHPDAYMSMRMSAAALVGNTVYFATGPITATFVEYDLERGNLDFIDKPFAPFSDHPVLMPWEGGRLGYAAVQESKLHVFSRDTRPDGTAAWTKRKVIELNRLNAPPSLNPGNSLLAVGYAQGYDVVFVATDAGVFAVNFKEGWINKTSNNGSIDVVIPYLSFYTPDYAAN